MTSSTPNPKPAVWTHDPKKLRRLGNRYDKVAADRAVRFFATYLSHTKGKDAGKPFELARWQEHRIIRPLFGWKRPDGTRTYREALIYVPRKNGKSTLCAGIAGLLLYADGEPGAEVYSAAIDRDQAAIVFETLKGMVIGNPKLQARSDVFRRSIVVNKTGASYKVLSADAPNKLGLNASGVIVDELAFHKSRDLFDFLSTSTGARSQPIIISITTAGVHREGSIFAEKYEYARQVADGIVDDPAFLAVLYEVPKTADWTTKAVWKKANPNLGVSLSMDYLEREAAKAHASVAAQNTFRMLHTNQIVQQEVRWIDLARWDASAGSVVEPDLRHLSAYGGLDLASVSDLTAWVLAVPVGDDVKFLARFFLPEAALEKGPNVALYRQWEPYLNITPGNATDYAFVRERVVADAHNFDLRVLNMDFLFQGGQLAGELIEEGIPVESFRQGHLSYALPMKEFERRLLEGTLHHGGNPVLRWMADNVVVRSDPAGNLKPDKDKSSNKIDGIAAMVMALGGLVREQEESPWVMTV